MIGIVIPGSPIITGGPITANMVVIDIVQPRNINNITLFLTEQIPDDCTASLYYSVLPFEALEFIGCVANQRPSDIFYTGWSLNPSVNVYESIKICVKLDKIEEVQMAFKDKIKMDINQEFAKRVAKNLYNYLDSYNQNQDVNSKLLVVPLNSLENWYQRFMQKYSIDPNFLMKTDL